MAGEATHVDVSVKIGGKVIPKDEVHDIIVERDLDQPDMASVAISNESTKFSETINEGDEFEVQLGLANQSDKSPVFKGEVTGIEPIYDTKAKRRVVIRGLNKLYVLARGKKLSSFLNSTDK